MEDNLFIFFAFFLEFFAQKPFGRRVGGVGWQEHAPLFVQFLSFSCSFQETFRQIIGWRSHFGVGTPVWEILDPPLKIESANNWDTRI